jgi:hypothetical protein
MFTALALKLSIVGLALGDDPVQTDRANKKFLKSVNFWFLKNFVIANQLQDDDWQPLQAERGHQQPRHDGQPRGSFVHARIRQVSQVFHVE